MTINLKEEYLPVPTIVPKRVILVFPSIELALTHLLRPVWAEPPGGGPTRARRRVSVIYLASFNSAFITLPYGEYGRASANTTLFGDLIARQPLAAKRSQLVLSRRSGPP